MYDFIVSLSTSHPVNGNRMVDFRLSNYFPTNTQTAYKIMQQDVINNIQKTDAIQWLSVALTIHNQHICIMKGDLDWFKQIEYFRKFIGTAEADDGFQQASFGFIDQKNNLRIEFENGIVVILPQ